MFCSHRVADIAYADRLPSTQVATLAGDGQEGFVDGPLGSARFSHPHAVAVTASGCLIVTAGRIFVADERNHRLPQLFVADQYNNALVISPRGLMRPLARTRAG